MDGYLNNNISSLRAQTISFLNIEARDCQEKHMLMLNVAYPIIFMIY